MPKGGKKTWGDDQTHQLKIDWANGFSGSQCADRLNAEFGMHYTRNSIIGRAHRLGLGRPERKVQSRQRKPRKFVVAPMSENAKLERLLEVIAPIVLEPSNPRKTIFEIGSHECRYPYGDRAPFMFCAAATSDTISYCAFHADLCFRPSEPRRAA